MLIYHITSDQEWIKAERSGVYRGDTLDSQGFIHCSTAGQLVRVANQRFAGVSGLVLLAIDVDVVKSELRYEAAEADELFPHIYGPLNLDAVTKVLPFEPNDNDEFFAEGVV